MISGDPYTIVYLTASGILLALAALYSNFNLRLTEDCSYSLWNLIVISICGEHLGRLQPTPQLRVWATEIALGREANDPNSSSSTNHLRAEDIVEVIPDFVIIFQKIGSLPPDHTSVESFLQSIRFGQFPCWTSFRLTKTYMPLIVELKRPITRHASTIKQYGFGLMRYMKLAQEQAELQSDCLALSQMYELLPSVILIAASGDYWSARIKPFSQSGITPRRAYAEITLKYNTKVDQEKELEVRFGLRDSDTDSSIITEGDSMQAVLGDTDYQDAWDYGDSALWDGNSDSDAGPIQTTGRSPTELKECRRRHDAFVKKIGPKQVYSAEELNDWSELHDPLEQVPTSRRYVTPGKWHATKFDKRQLTGRKWSPVFRIGTKESADAMAYIENLVSDKLEEITADEGEAPRAPEVPRPTRGPRPSRRR
jgi:hypothetical protein